MRYLPPFSIAFTNTKAVSSHELVAGKHFHLGFDSWEQLFWTNPSPRLLDLLRIAISVYAVDRLARRKQISHRRRWSRSVRLTVAVNEPGFWNTSDVLSALRECLEFLGGDDWEFKFVRNDCDVSRPIPLFRPFTVPPLVCLYSGGLDSAAGLAIRIAENAGRPIIPVTVWHQAHQRESVHRQFEALRQRYNTSIHPLIVKAAIVWSSELAEWKRKQERSQRCRSFLFASVGAVAAAMSEVSTVEVFESGIGAINLPLMAGMVGSRATRGCHPYFLRLMSHLASLSAECDISFSLPFVDKTKGEVVSQLAKAGLEGLACSTVSCVHYPLHEQVYKQCGVCPACIFRRQAMMVAEIAEPQGTYKYDLFSQSHENSGIEENHLKYLKAFLLQVANLGSLTPDMPLPSRVQRHLLGTNVVSSGRSLAPFVRLLSRYRDEWLGLAAQSKEHEWSWSGLMVPV